MATRPVVLPETFSGNESFVDWLDHFETVVEVNTWDKAAMAPWLCLRLVGHAQNAIKSLSETERADYDSAKAKLMERFEPASKCALYKAEFQSRQKRLGEDWASFGKELRSLATKVFSDLDETARE